MKSFLAINAVLALVGAYDHGFPNDDSFHAGCHMNTKLVSTTCNAAYDKSNTLINDNVDTDSQYKGQMGIHSESGEPTTTQS